MGAFSRMKKQRPSPRSRINGDQALALHRSIAALMREFKLEPGLLAGSVYANLHANDIGLFEVLTETSGWTVNRIAETLAAPITTVSSALDRLERHGLVERRRIPADRRVVRIELTGDGQRLATRLRDAHVKNCVTMLARLAPAERELLIRMVGQIATPQDADEQGKIHLTGRAARRRRRAPAPTQV